MIYIVIPVFNRWHFTLACLQSLRNLDFTDFKIIVVDHGSTDCTHKNIIQDFPEVVLLKGNEKMWWTAATNVGVKYALENGAAFVLTLNNDLIVKPNYLQELSEVARQYPKALIGSVSADIKNPNKVVFAGTRWNRWTAKYRPAVNIDSAECFCKEIIESDLLPGRGTLIPAAAFHEVGLFDEIRFPHYAADEDFSLQCRKSGYRLFVTPKSIVYIETEATGLNGISFKRKSKYWKMLFTSQRSSVNLKRRWIWAKKNTPIPHLYFLFDLVRITFSEFKK